MYPLKSRAQKLKRTYGNMQFLAKHGDYSTQIRHNVVEARIIAFETSPRRVISRNAYKHALFATRRLVGSLFDMRKHALEDWHRHGLNSIEHLLQTARLHAMAKSFDISIAQDVFVLLSHFLGENIVPEVADVDKTSSLRRRTSQVVERVWGVRRAQKVHSSQGVFVSTKSACTPRSKKQTFPQKRSKSCVALSELDSDFFDDQVILLGE